ncbi:unnamed protein product [Aspergillus oryzae]|uniref:Unnamed protein product n=2 Tax=Aspergillus oryzae TaxID=5062 RepID=A0AAN5C028_ASPOZ|nr:unnamed protein product [Aspergillus oryzae]GMF86609.1 unnamed protein product [Aspergillus oryzae]GMG14541.1 unnamed protein product [Aspergillus oryzae]GMG33801.1 unnamed protein product [Aspergillus oryzae]GMG54642.1 unnamed protein product [Aspergillus oryzae var. brunneus]
MNNSFKDRTGSYTTNPSGVHREYQQTFGTPSCAKAIVKLPPEVIAPLQPPPTFASMAAALPNFLSLLLFHSRRKLRLCLARRQYLRKRLS